MLIVRIENVLLVGAGTSSTEIARELGPIAHKIYQSGRGTPFELPVDFIPENCQRIGEIASFDLLQRNNLDCENVGSIPGTVTLKDGTVLSDIDMVIVCTGYHFTYPFLPELHADEDSAGVDLEKVLVRDGSCTLNLHKDMFYLPDPTLAFVGVSLFISTFTFFEFQAIAIAAVFSGRASLPSPDVMRAHYEQRLASRGPTRMMNARMDEEVSYVDEIVGWLNESDPMGHVEGFTPKWHAARDIGKLEKIRARFARGKAEQERATSLPN